jgi:raffinose/stachyose/melibiose transport system permease protein
MIQEKAKFGTRFSRVFMNIYVLISSLGCIFPIIWLFYSSLKTQSEFDVNNFSLPTSPTFQNYLQVMQTSNMPRYILNSIIVSVSSVLLIVLFSFIIGYFLSRFNFKGKKILFSLFLLGMLVPVHSLMVPMYVIFSKLHFNDHLFALILPYICFQLPIGIYLVESYIHSIPFEMEDAASIDGASFTKTLFNIILPMAKSVLITVGIISFFFCWNEFSFALILTTGEKMRTVPLGLALFQGSFTTNYPILMAAMIIATLPTLILYSIFSRKIMDGMVAGAVKG